MDWQKLRKEASEWFDDTSGDCDVDEVCGDVLRFIPERPNDPADAEWLKQRGWERFLETWSLPGTELNWYRGYLRCGHAQLDLDPSRMIVALFEAAAKEAMKHGQ